MIKKGQKIMLWNPKNSIMTFVDGETKKIKNLGIIDTERFIGMNIGEKMTLGDEKFYLLKPAMEDIPNIFRRGPQIIQPEFASLIVQKLNISCGDRIVEGGAGSGALTSVLLSTVGKDGRVTTYEINDLHAALAKKNVKMMDMVKNWDIVVGDVRYDVDEKDLDAFFVDIPEPWGALDMAEESLKPGGRFGGFVPTTNQLEKTIKEMRSRGYIRVKGFESFVREMVVHEGGVRPSFETLGHNGYIAVGIKTV